MQLTIISSFWLAEEMQFADKNAKEIKQSAHAYWSIPKKREPERETANQTSC